MGFLEDRDMSNVPTIPEFYKEKTIFITGGSGFMGQVLIEKLLYSCTDLERIYLLLRAKKGVTSDKRLASLYKSSCFDRLREERPGVFEAKVTGLAGDVMELGLGLSDEDREILIEGSFISIVADSCRGRRVSWQWRAVADACRGRRVSWQWRACWYSRRYNRFDDPLPYAVKLNLRGTREMVTLAKEMKQLVSFVHVSTCYSNCDRDVVEEVIYSPHTDWRDTIEICEKIKEMDVKMLTEKFLGKIPNTYVFTKQLAEHVINEQKGLLPVVMVRPSVVISSEKEPMPGWNNNFNGPVGIMTACGKGILRSLLTAPDIASDYIPVDASIKSIIAAGWIRGTKKVEPSDDLAIYNSCGNGQFSLTMRELSSIGYKVGHDYPLTYPLWYPYSTMTQSKLLFDIRVLFLHLIPAMIVDLLLWLTGKKTFLLKIQRRIYVANLAISYFMQKTWTFDSKNFLSLCNRVKEEDKKQFDYKFAHLESMKEEFLKSSILGGRKYVLRQKDEEHDRAVKQHIAMKYLDMLVRYSLYAFIIYKYLSSVYFQNILHSFTELF